MSSVGGLRVFVDPGSQQRRTLTPWDELPRFRDFELTGPGNNVYNAAGYCIDLALAIHESREGRRAMADVGRSVIYNWDRDRVRHLYRDRFENMENWVDLFIAVIRRSFPNLYVTGTLDSDGGTLRLDGRASRLTDFDPKAGAIIFIQRWMVDIITFSGAKYKQYVSENRREAADEAQHNWDTAVFSLTNTFAHELIHVFVGFLMGGNREMTPPRSTHPGFGNSRTGESGWMWEGLFYNGIPTFIENPDNRFGSQQAGIPYLRDTDGEERCKRISRRWIADLVRGGKFSPPVFSFPTPHEADIGVVYFADKHPNTVDLRFPCEFSSHSSLRYSELLNQGRLASRIRKDAMSREVPRDVLRAGYPRNRYQGRGRSNVNRDDLQRINRAPAFTFRASQYPVPQRV